MNRQTPFCPTLTDLANEDLLDDAFAWLCKQRANYPDSSDVWELRRCWSAEKRRILCELRSGAYRFGLLSRFERDGKTFELWSSRDALVLKALALLLARCLPVSPLCVHVRGHGGAKSTVRAIAHAVKRLPFVFRTDVRSYYASVEHGLLLDRLARYVPDRGLLNLIAQYLTRTSESGGEYHEHRKGISLGCALSPLIGAFFLKELDDAFARTGLFYRRFMDDVVILAPTRWKLRRAVKQLNEIFAKLHLDKHPDKTYVGSVAKGFDFLGYRVDPKGLAVSAPTVARFVERATRLQEQDREERSASSPFGKYVRRWLGRVRAVGAVHLDFTGLAYSGLPPPG